MEDKTIEFDDATALAYAEDCLKKLDGTDYGLRLAAGAVRIKIMLAYKIGKHNAENSTNNQSI